MPTAKVTHPIFPPVLSVGCGGGAVRVLHVVLIEAGYLGGLSEEVGSATYGAQTAEAVTHLQEHLELIGHVIPGIFDGRTKAELLKLGIDAEDDYYRLFINLLAKPRQTTVWIDHYSRERRQWPPQIN